MNNEMSFDAMNDAERNAKQFVEVYHDFYSEGKLEAMATDIEAATENLRRVVAALLARGVITVQDLDKF